MPVVSCQVLADPVILFCVLDHGHIQINNAHALGSATQPRHWSYVGQGDLRDTSVSFARRTTCVGKENCASVLKSAGSERAVEEEGF